METRKDILLGQEVIFSERTARDVLDLADFANKLEINEQRAVFINARCIEDGLKWHINSLPFWAFFRKRKLRRMSKARQLVKELSINEISRLALVVVNLENTEAKKKAAAQPAIPAEGQSDV